MDLRDSLAAEGRHVATSQDRVLKPRVLGETLCRGANGSAQRECVLVGGVRCDWAHM